MKGKSKCPWRILDLPPRLSSDQSYHEAVFVALTVVGLTASSAEKSNNYRFQPIGYEILQS